MNKLTSMIVGGSLVLGAASVNAAEVSGNVAIASDYVYRGISQTDESPAISGGLDLATDSGFYAGVWGSNVQFGDGEVSAEFDFYFGLGGDISDDLSYDVGYLYYAYPNQDTGADYAFQEIYASLSFMDFTGGFAYSNDFFGESGTGTYYYAEYSLGLPNEFGVDFHIGKTDVDDISLDYVDYSIALNKSMGGLDWSLGWYDTDLSKTDCGGDICDSRVVLSVAKSL
ncbi:MAG: TorF family putative porin [Pseudomonadales bacterium]|nr:TorF family putative porin [Pseudomonadales bacterium]